MEGIKVGEYVRTKDGDLFILENIIDNEVIPRGVDLPYAVWKDDIIKHSPNIIDLIEVGDYVNGFRILEKTKIKDGNMQVCILKDNNTSNWITINSYTLKSIVTKEQFSSVEYRMEEGDK